MRCNWWRWLWGLVPLLVLSWVAVQAEHGRMEADLRERAVAALARGGMSGVSPRLAGRDVVLTGLASDEAEPKKAMGLVQGVWGVRVVDNGIDLAPLAEKYTWAAIRRGNRVRIFGHVPNRATRKAILGVAKANFPGFEVIDRMSTTRGVPNTDAWLGGVSFALKQLANIKRGDVRLDGLGLRVAGEAEDVAAYRALKTALANGLPIGISLAADLVTAPVVSPFIWSAQFVEGRVVFLGYVTTEAVRAELLATAGASVPSGTVIDKMQPGEGAAQGFAKVAVASVRELARLADAVADLKDATLVVSGIAADAATADAARTALRTAVPATIRLVDQIKIREPRPALPPSPTVEPQTSPPKAQAPDASQPAALPTAPAPAIENKADSASATPTPMPAPTSPPTETGALQPAAPTPAHEPEAQAKACENRLQSLVAGNRILFEVASAELDRASLSTLDRLAETVKSCPGLNIEVAGHASSEGSQATNQELSLKRAKSVIAYLVQVGVDSAQLQSVGYGASRPVAPNDSTENMAKNRRIEFAVRPK